MKTPLLLLTVLSLFISCQAKQDHQTLYLATESVQTAYAIDKAPQLFETDAVSRTNDEASADIIVRVDEANAYPNLRAEGFVLKKTEDKKWQIIGKDAIGAMYGIFDVTEQLSFGNPLKEKTVSPSLRNRFIKFNLPWSSYRKGEVIAQHEETCRDTTYWASFLDMMAVNRFNVLSLWNLQPFTDMIRPEKYPEASSLSDEELAEHQQFWRTLFRMANERGIQTYIVNWNIFLPDAFVEAHDIKAYKMKDKHWGQGYTSELIEDYTRECVKQVINEYPGLTGIGVTLGEGMGGMTSSERKDWIDRSILEGMRMADRKVKLLYRAPLSSGTSSTGDTDKRTEVMTREVLDTLNTPSETLISFKYNWSHGHSSEDLFIVHGGKLTDTYWNPVPHNYSVLWTVRNEDFFIHRWAEPDFARHFIQNNVSQSYMSGCILGSECYIPAKDYFSNEKGKEYFHYAYERQWLWYSIWGRLLYDNSTSDDLFAQQLNKHFNIQYGEDLLDTWKIASSYYHLLSSFYMGTWDAALYSEAFTSMMRIPKIGKNKVDIITMEALGNRPVLDSKRYVNITDYVLNKSSIDEQITTPPELVEILNGNAERILKDLSLYRKQNPVGELAIELTDIETLAYLQLFFAERINATLLLGEHILLDQPLAEEQIKAHLDASIAHWQTIIELKERYNKEKIPYIFNPNMDYRQYLKTLQEERDNFQNIKEFWVHQVSTLSF